MTNEKTIHEVDNNQTTFNADASAIEKEKNTMSQNDNREADNQSIIIEDLTAENAEEIKGGPMNSTEQGVTGMYGFARKVS